MMIIVINYGSNHDSFIGVMLKLEFKTHAPRPCRRYLHKVPEIKHAARRTRGKFRAQSGAWLGRFRA
eukprot:COSAG06_NODE_2791_length_6280_cov_86.969422_3_plen_67_part_00